VRIPRAGAPAGLGRAKKDEFLGSYPDTGLLTRRQGRDASSRRLSVGWPVRFITGPRLVVKLTFDKRGQVHARLAEPGGTNEPLGSDPDASRHRRSGRCRRCAAGRCGWAGPDMRKGLLACDAVRHVCHAWLLCYMSRWTEIRPPVEIGLGRRPGSGQQPWWSSQYSRNASAAATALSRAGALDTHGHVQQPPLPRAFATAPTTRGAPSS
jgi:hypothetical protein